MKRILLVLLCVLTLPVVASHIVGGEFEIRHVSGNTYRVNLILYFDELNGQSGARDPNVVARIFRKHDNVMLRDVFLPMVSQTPVSYTQPECSKGEIVTTKIVYSAEVVLSPSQFSDPGGYYIAWERCCRNYTITNVISQDPAFGTYAGQTFYLEFPAVVKDGQPFINSTPRLFPPLNDFACPYRPYYVDFAGVDDDGDSLVYSLVTPLNTKSGDALPAGGPRPRPYPNVIWNPPFGLNNVMNGQPDLKISTDGLITVTPTSLGLYVFAVKCEEFREGVKIGEVRRDFQMLVVDKCPQAEPPQILGKKLTDSDFTYDEVMDVTFASGISDDDRCIVVQVSDPDASSIIDNYEEKVKIKAVPLGFKANVNGILPDVTSAVLTNGSTMEFEICFPECPYVPGPFQIGIVAYDDACSLPLFDTLKVNVNITPPPNTVPYFTSLPPDNVMVQEGVSLQSWTVAARDNDNDPMILGVVPIGFNLADAGMSFSITHQEDGLIEGTFTWDPKCDVYDFATKTDFDIRFIVEDSDYCNISSPVMADRSMHIILPPNADPVIDSDLTPDLFERKVEGINKQMFDVLEFTVTGTDADNDWLVLSAQGVGFNMEDVGAVFATADGTGSISSNFYWNIACDKVNLDIQSLYQFQFVVVDDTNKCRVHKTDTLDVFVNVFPASNSRPDLIINSLNQDLPLVAGELSTLLGNQIELGLFGTDPDDKPDRDFLRLELIDARGTVAPKGYVFAPAEGKGAVETTFSWNPDCSIFEEGVFENEYKFVFCVYDDRCFNIKGDTVEVNMIIRDVESDVAVFLPPNFVSPNGDNCNDYFVLEAYDMEDGCGAPITPNLPKDNCVRRFEGIKIYNRWGKEVFESNRRDFRWYAGNHPNGIYYYLLKFSDYEYKGSITVRY